MKNFPAFAFLIMVVSGLMMSCSEKHDLDTTCQSFELNKPFTARLGETWCYPAENWQITFGPQIEDSRCNYLDDFIIVECFWEGRYVMAVTIDNGEAIRDTFFAVDNWRDTLYNGPFTVILDKVLPETRMLHEPLDSSAYSFNMLIK